MILATRTMKARRSGGVCPSCKRTLIRGQGIALVGHRWHHATCVAQRIRGDPRPAAPSARETQ